MGRRPIGGRVDELNKGAWTSLEDKMLRDYVTAHGNRRWSTVAREAGLSRCAKSCRLRWLNYLRPGIKRGNMTEDEEDLIIRLHKLLGNRWSLIAGRLPGRTDNEIKNYWHTNLAKKEKAGRSRSSNGTVDNHERKTTERSDSGQLQHDITKSRYSSSTVSREPTGSEDRDSEPERSKSGDNRPLSMSPVEGPAHFEADFLDEDVNQVTGMNFDFINFPRIRDYEASLIGSASDGRTNDAGGDRLLGQSPEWLPEGFLESWSAEFDYGEDLFLQGKIN